MSGTSPSNAARTQGITAPPKEETQKDCELEPGDPPQAPAELDVDPWSSGLLPARENEPLGKDSRQSLTGQLIGMRRRRVVKASVESLDRCFDSFHKERIRITPALLFQSAKRFVLSDLKEKAENCLHFKKLAKSLWSQARRYGKGFAIFALVSWLCDDFIVPGILYACKCYTAATFVFFGHFEPVTYPMYFITAALIRRYFKSSPKKNEYLALLARVRESMEDQKTFSQRLTIMKDFMKKSGPFVAGVSIEDLSAEYSKETASSTFKFGRREQAAKFLGRTLVQTGVKTRLGHEIFKLLLRRTRDKDPWVRKVAVGAFGKFADKLPPADSVEAWHEVSAHLPREKEADVIVRGAAARSLGAFPNCKTIDVLSNTLEDSGEDWWVKRYAIESIGSCLDALNGRDEPVARHEVTRAVHLLCHALKEDPSIEVRTAAAAALGRVPHYHGSRETSALSTRIDMALISGLIEDKDPTVRENSLWAVSRRALSREENRPVSRWMLGLTHLLPTFDSNMQKLSLEIMKCAESRCSGEVRAEIKERLKNFTVVTPKPSGIQMVAIDSLLDEANADKCRQFDCKAVQAFVHGMRDQGHCVMYTRNFLHDRSDSPMKQDGAIDIFSTFDTVKFHKAVDSLKRGEAAQIPWIDFPRGKVIASRTMLPSDGKSIIVVGTRAELEALGALVGIPAEQIATPSLDAGISA